MNGLIWKYIPGERIAYVSGAESGVDVLLGVGDPCGDRHVRLLLTVTDMPEA